MHASLLSIEHCSAASALSSALRLASSYVISSSSDGPGDASSRSRLGGAAVGIPVLAKETRLMLDVTLLMVGGVEAALAAAAFSLAFFCVAASMVN